MEETQTYWEKIHNVHVLIYFDDRCGGLHVYYGVIAKQVHVLPAAVVYL